MLALARQSCSPTTLVFPLFSSAASLNLIQSALSSFAWLMPRPLTHHSIKCACADLIPSFTGWGDGIEWVKFEDSAALSASTGKPVMVVIHKSWCGACKVRAPRAPFHRLHRRIPSTNAPFSQTPLREKETALSLSPRYPSREPTLPTSVRKICFTRQDIQLQTRSGVHFCMLLVSAWSTAHSHSDNAEAAAQ